MKNLARRVTAFVLTLVLLLTVTPVLADGGLSVSVQWIDGSGQVRYVPALPVSDGEGYWATLDPMHLGEYLAAQVVDASGYAAGETTFQWVQDAEYLDPAYAQYVPYSAGELLLYVSSRPMPVDGVDYKSGYGYVDASSVNLREGPSTNHGKIASVKHYGYCQILGAEKSGGYTWYYVGINGVYGYLRADNFKVLSENQRADFLNSYEYEAGAKNNSHLVPAEPSVPGVPDAPVRTEKPVVTAPPAQETDPVYDSDPMTAFGYVTASSVNLREGPSTRYDVITKLYTYALVNVLGSDDGWYLVEYNGQAGYLSGDYVKVLRESELERFLNSYEYEAGVRNNATEAPATERPATERPGITDAPIITDAPVITAPPIQDNDPVTAFGYVDATSVNLREGPSTKTDIVGKFYTYALVNVLGSDTSSGVTWYLVEYNGQLGYLHGDYVKVLRESELERFLNSYEYEAGIRNNTTPEPATEAPVTAPPVVTDAPANPVYVPVYYYSEDGTLLDEQWKSFLPGTQRVTPDSSKVKGMTLVSDASVTVTVYADGVASPASVTFLYEAEKPTEAPTNTPKPDYKSGFGYVTASSVNVRTGPSTKDKKIAAFEHYVLCEVVGSTQVGKVTWYEVSARDVTGWVHGDYLKLLNDRELAEFKESWEYISVNVPAKDATITVYYMHVGNTQLDVQTLTLAPGEHTVKADSNAVKGLVPVGSTEAPVTVSREGVAEPASITFWYEDAPVAVVEAEVTVEYRLESGELLDMQKQFLAPGEHPVYAASTAVDGLIPVGETYQTVYVSEKGKATPNPVVFTYRRQLATVTIHYQDGRGRDVAPEQKRNFEDGRHVIVASPENLADTWELAPGVADRTEILVDRGVPSQKDVYFYYQQKQPKQADITVRYYDTEGNPIAADQTMTFSVGVHTIKAAPEGLPKDYELVSEGEIRVEVFANGTISPQEVAFYYRKVKEEPKTADVRVYYEDGQGRSVASSRVYTLANGAHTLYPEPEDLMANYVLDPAMPSSVEVVVRSGVANKPEVTFYYQYVAPKFDLPVYYYDTLGETIAATQSIQLAAGQYAIKANPTDLPEGYTLVSDEILNVTVFEGGATEPEEIAFYYRAPERRATLSVYILDAYEETVIAGPFEKELAPGYHTVLPEKTWVPQGYDGSTVKGIDVYVSRDGKAEPELVRFYIAPVPTEAPTATPTQAPTATPTAVPYSGYALTTRSTALRTGVSSSELSVIQTLQANELVLVSSQLTDAQGESWSIVTTLRGQAGYMRTADLRYISNEEAKPYLDWWDEINATAQPTEYATPTPEPMQVKGYAVTVGDNVPFRQMASEYSRIIDNLEMGEVVYISGQNYVDGITWHSVTYESRWGYIRSDLVRMMTIAEEENYLDSLNKPTPTMATTNRPFDENGLSSYGYVDASSVYFREGPSTNDKRIGELKRYAFCLVRGAETVNGQTWYQVSYGGKTGYVHGDYLHQMTISELEDFLGSDEYRQGIQNNSATGNDPDDDLGFTGTGGLVSPEDQTVNQWQNTLPQVSFQPFNPIGTVQPIVTLEPLPGSTATEAPTATPSPTPTFDPLPNVTYPTTEPTGSGGSMIVWGVVIGLLVIAVGGVFFIVQYQQKRRRIALRAAQRRAQAARAAQMQQRPYAAQAGQPRSATRAPEAGTVRRPAARTTDSPEAPYRPYTRPEGQPYGSYGQNGATPDSASQANRATDAGRTGRRSERHRPEDQDHTENF